MFKWLGFFTTVLASWSADHQATRWLAHQPSEWAAVGQVAIIFADARWLGAARELAREVEKYGHHAALYLWIEQNRTALCAPGKLCFVDSSPFGSSAGQTWGSRAYFSRIDQRVPLVSALVDRLAPDGSRGVAVLDADIVLQRNVFARFARTEATLVIQQEWPCASAPYQLCANGGLYWVRRTKEGQQILARVSALMHRLRLPDQDAFDVVLSRTEQSLVHYLDRQLYANGYTLQFDSMFRARLAHAIHVNWLPSVEHKLDALARFRRGCT